jgi:hypothetical protein
MSTDFKERRREPFSAKVRLLACLVRGYSGLWSIPAAPEAKRDLPAFAALQGSLNSDSKMFKLDSNAGYDFNKHFGVFVGDAGMKPRFISRQNKGAERLSAPFILAVSTCLCPCCHGKECHP